MNHASRETCIHYAISEFLVQTYLCKYVYFNVRDFILFLRLQSKKNICPVRHLIDCYYASVWQKEKVTRSIKMGASEWVWRQET